MFACNSCAPGKLNQPEVAMPDYRLFCHLILYGHLAVHQNSPSSCLLLRQSKDPRILFELPRAEWQPQGQASNIKKGKSPRDHWTTQDSAVGSSSYAAPDNCYHNGV